MAFIKHKLNRFPNSKTSGLMAIFATHMKTISFLDFNLDFLDHPCLP